MSGHQGCSSLALINPVSVGERRLLPTGELVEDGVPSRVQVLGTSLLLESEEVPAHISLLEFGVVSGGGVKRLMEVTDIVDQQSESNGFHIERVLLWEKLVGCDLLVSVRVLVISLLFQDADELWDDKGGVMWVELDFHLVSRVVVIEDGLVSEVPLVLVTATFGFDVVSESGRLNHSVISLFLYK